MAQQGWAPGNLVRGPAIITAAPFTMCAWAKTSNIAAGGNIIGLHNSSATGNLNQFKLATSTSGDLVYRVGNAATSAAATASAAFSNNTWFHACAVEYSSASRAVLLNGGSKVADTTSLVPSGINRASIGLRDHSGNDQAWANDALAATGQIAEAAYWNIALTDDEIAALAEGFSPLLIRPQSLVAFIPLVRDVADVKGNAFAIVGSLTVADHCRVYLPG